VFNTLKKIAEKGRRNTKQKRKVEREKCINKQKGRKKKSKERGK
jgi:hypothetical protein